MLILGIAGGTGSGKTTFAKALQSAMGDNCVIVPQDAYYIANTDISFAERIKVN